MIGARTGAALTGVLWGFTYLLAARWLPHHPLMVAAVRAFGGAAFLFCLARAWPPQGWWGRIIALGTLNTGLFFGLFFIGAMRLQGGVAAIFQALGPLVVLIMAWAMLRQRPTAPQFLSLALGVLGVALVVLKDGAAIDRLGVAAMTGSVLAFALSNVLMNLWGPAPIAFAPFTGWQLLIGGSELALVAWLLGDFGPVSNGSHLLALLILGTVLTGVPFLLWFRAISQIGAVNVMPFILLTPITALLLDAMVLQLMPAPLQLLGVAIVILALLLNQRAARGRG